jgi:hypothetical protein
VSQKVDSKDFKLVKSNPINNSGSSGIELVIKGVQQVPREVWINGATTLIDQITKRLDNEREETNKIRERRTDLLYLEIKDLLETTQKEMAKEDFNQERINMLHDRIDKKGLELKEMQGDADGLFKSIKQYIAMRSKRE